MRHIGHPNVTDRAKQDGVLVPKDVKPTGLNPDPVLEIVVCAVRIVDELKVQTLCAK